MTADNILIADVKDDIIYYYYSILFLLLNFIRVLLT